MSNTIDITHHRDHRVGHTRKHVRQTYSVCYNNRVGYTYIYISYIYMVNHTITYGMIHTRYCVNG